MRWKCSSVEDYFGSKEGRWFLVRFSEFAVYLWKVPHLHKCPKIQQAVRDLLRLTEEACSREGIWTRSPDLQTSLIITSSSFFWFHCWGDHQEIRHYTTLTFCLFEELWSLQLDIFYPRQLIALGCSLARSVQRQFFTQDRVKLEYVVTIGNHKRSGKKKKNGEKGKRGKQDGQGPKRKKQPLVLWHGFENPLCDD